MIIYLIPRLVVEKIISMKRKIGVYTATALSGLALFGIVITSHGVDGLTLLERVKAGNAYALNLNTSNRITSNISSATEITQRTARGSEITFEYSNCSANSSYHAVINNGGTIINVDSIGGITSLTPVFTTTNGELKLRAGYSPNNLGDYVVLKSGLPYMFDGEVEPNFIEFSATGGSISLTSVSYLFECSEYVEECFEKVTSSLSDYSGTYLIVDETSSVALKNENSTTNTFNVSINNNRILRSSNTDTNELTVTKKDSSTYIFRGKGLDQGVLDYELSADSGTLFWGSSASTYSSSISYQNGLFAITASSHYLLFENSHFTYYKTSVASGTRLVSLYKANFGSGNTNSVVYDTGITVTDKKASGYGIGDIFDNYVGSSGLKVTANKSGSDPVQLESSEFTYVIKDGNTIIPSNTAFESTGTYTVTVSYKNYFTASYTITVNEQPLASEYELVTDASTLEVGQQVIITNGIDGSCYAMSETQNTNNRSVQSITITDGVPAIVDGVCEFELVAGTVSNTFAFYDSTNDGYIAANSSGTSNVLKLVTGEVTKEASFAISFSGNAANIVSQTSINKDTIRYNSNNGTPIFSCYQSGNMSAVYLFAKAGAAKVPVQSVSLNQSTINLQDGGQYSLSATVLPVDASNKEVTWTSGDTSIATVSDSGVVTATGVGTTTITVTSKSDSTKFATCTVNVSAIAVTGVSLNTNSLPLFVGDSSTLTATVSPSNATDKSVTWTSSDSTIASVSNSGVVTAKKVGTATITVTTTDGGKTATCSVTVSPVTVTGFSITESELDMYVGDDDVTLTTEITPSNATDKTVAWTTSDASVATVSNGVVHAVGEGTATITGTCNNIADTVTVTVHPEDEKPVTTIVDGTFMAGTQCSNVTVNDHDAKKVGTGSLGGVLAVKVPAKTQKLTIYIGAWNGVSNLSLNLSTETTGVSISPTSLDLSPDTGLSGNSPFTLANSEENYKHEITLSGVTSETTILFATSIAKRCVAWLPSCEVVQSGAPSVVAVTGVNVTPATKTLDVGEEVQLTAEVLPHDATNKTVSWSSNNTSKATVSSTGLVTAKALGTATITATTADGGYTSTCTITVVNSVVSVTSVSLSVSSKTLTVDEEFVLTATVSPSDATNKSVNWSSSNTSVATVNNGTVLAKAVGTATITVTTVDGSKTATCTVTVQASGGTTPSQSATDVIDNAATTSHLGGSASSSWVNDFSVTLTSGASYTIHSMGTSGTSNALQWNKSGYLYSTVSGGEITGVSVVMTGGKSVTCYGSKTAFSSNSGGTSMGTLTGTGSLTSTAGYTFIRIVGASTGNAITSITIQYGTPDPVDPTSITIPSTATLSPGGTTTLDVTYDAAANQHKEVYWYSSQPSVASIDKTTGLITAVSLGTTKITAKLRINESIVSNQCTLTVQEQVGDKWTIMIYMCGADLESGGGAASGDIKEILSISNQPDDVNIIIETGGSNSWSLGSSYIQDATSIPSNNLGRWHVSGKKLVKDSFISQANMGSSNTYRDFLNWGLTNYPAEKVGVILWNHGGGLDGVCFDEKNNDDSLTNSEMKTAHTSAIGSNKLEFIGYDACLMQNMEIAEFNSSYYNYQVASQESENGDGWNYTKWVDDLYAKKSTPVILQEIVDGFITTEGTGSDQTLSYLNLNYMSTFKSAFESYASALKSKLNSGSVSSSTFVSYVKSKVKNYSSAGYCGYGQFDIKDWVSKCQSQNNYKVDASYATAVNNALADLIAYNRVGTSAGASNGLSLTYRCHSQVSYSSSQSGFTNWISFNSSYHA